MIFIERFSKRKTIDNPVYNSWKETKGIDDDHARKVNAYLSRALESGLSTSEIVDSCYDLAATTTIAFQEDGIKKLMWQESSSERLSLNRPSRTIKMQLYPSYFDAILKGIKTYEGRALDPYSDKDYTDLREGDEIVFSVCKEIDNWQKQCDELGLNPDLSMKTTIGGVYYSPTVHGIYEFTPAVGAVGQEFQPMINGTSELLELQRAAVYYAFPGYKDKIKKYGFLGIQILSPRPFR